MTSRIHKPHSTLQPSSVRGSLAIAAAWVLMGCAVPVEPDASETSAQAAQPLVDSQPASAFFFERSALSNGTCTATRIANRFILTAAHCRPEKGQSVWFYTSGPDPDPDTERKVIAVTKRPGVHPGEEDYTDGNGNFADIAVVELDGPGPSGGHNATLAWHFPSGGDELGTKVGAASPLTCTNPFGLPCFPEQDPPSRLRMKTDPVYSDNDGGGSFLTEDEGTEPGDSGGGFFDDGRLLGVLHGFAFEWEYRSKFTSVPFHLNWILGVKRYSWSGDAPNAGLGRFGATIDTISPSTERVCQYACDHRSVCVAYTFANVAGTTACFLLSTVDGLVASPDFRSALK